MSFQMIRALWGDYSTNENIRNREKKWIRRRFRIDNEIENICKNKFNNSFVTYVFGEENYKKLKKMNLDCVLANKNPSPFTQTKLVYRNKLELIKYAMEVDKYDEVLYMDWDCVPTKKIPDDFLTEFRKKNRVQACLQNRRSRVLCPWRQDDKKIVSNGGFVYINGISAIKDIIDLWEEKPCYNDEPAISKYIDNLIGGWKGIEEYWSHFEAPFCHIKKSPYSKEKLSKKNVCFLHS